MGMVRDCVALGLAGLVLIATLSGCADPTPREALTEGANEKCREVNERFSGDLAFSGEGVGMDDMETVRDRSSLIKELGQHVRGLARPESGQAELDAWLSKLDDFAADMDELDEMYQNARPGSDLPLAMQVGIVDDAAVAASQAAKKFGLGDCAHPAVESWTIFPSSWES